MDVKNAADARKSYRKKLRSKFSKHVAALPGKANHATNPTMVAESKPGSFETLSKDDEEEQSQVDSDEDEKQLGIELDMWAEAEKKLQKDKEQRHIMEEYNQILEAHFNVTIAPIGTQDRRKQFATFLASEIDKLQQAQMEDDSQWNKCKRRAKRCFETAARATVTSKDIIAPATNTCLPAGVACTGVAVILRFCLTAIEQRQVLFESLDKVSGSIRRIAEYEALCQNATTERNKETEDALTDACYNILVFQARVLCFLQKNRVASTIRNMFEWDGWNKLLLGIADAERRVKSCAEREQMKKVTGIFGKMNELLQQQQNQKDDERRGEKIKFLQLLQRNTCIYEDSKQRNRKRVLGTCDWFTGHTLFTAWDSRTDRDTPSLLYVTADPGCGKSVLSRYLVDHILPDDNRTVCYFFFKDEFEKQKSAKSALCAILHQLFVKNPHLITDDVLYQYGSRGKDMVESFVILWGMFTDAASHQETVCVLDALDECRGSDMEQLVDAISGTIVPGLRFLLTSRPYAHIRRTFPARILSLIEVKGDQSDLAHEIAEEIKLVVDNRVDATADALELTLEERQLMRDQLSSVPNRTYLWVSLVFDGLMGFASGITKADIFNLTRQLPNGISAAYDKILQKSQDRAQTRRLLHLILAAERPLTLSEVSVALVLDGSQPWEDVKERLTPKSRLREAIRNLCGLFVSVVDDRVYLLHQTAREFLLHDEPHNDDFCDAALSADLVLPTISDSWRASMSLSESNELLAEACIARLLPSSEIEPDIPLFEYSLSYWPTHYVRSGPHFRMRMGKATLSLISTRAYEEDYYFTFKEEDPFIVASYFGIDGALKTIMSQNTGDKKALVNQMDSYRRTPLYCAIERGHEAIVELLLATELVDVNQPAGRWITPLQRAVECGREAIVQLLLATKQVDVNLGIEYDRTPFAKAAYMGHETIFKLLFATEGVEVNAKDGDGRTPLSLAATGGHETIVKFLLTTEGVEIDAKDDYGRTPLSWAATNGHEAVIKLLLATEGVEIDTKDGEGQTPLSLAAQGGHEDIVDSLLDMGVEIDSKDADGRTPLLHAARTGRSGVLRQLLAAGADVHAKDKDGRTPLSWASGEGHAEIAEILLLEAGADLHTRDHEDGDEETFWIAGEAVAGLSNAEGHEVDLDNDGLTPLSWAAQGGHMAVVRLLLAAGADANAKNHAGETPLALAAANGHDVVELFKPVMEHCEEPASGLLEEREDHCEESGFGLLEPREEHCEEPGSGLLKAREEQQREESGFGEAEPREEHCEEAGSGLLKAREEQQREESGFGEAEPREEHCEEAGSGRLKAKDEHFGKSVFGLCWRHVVLGLVSMFGLVFLLGYGLFFA